MPNKTYKDFIRETHKRGLTPTEIETLTAFSGSINRIATSVNMAQGNSRVKNEVYQKVHDLSSDLNNLLRLGKKETITNTDNRKLNNRLFKDSSRKIYQTFTELSKPENIKIFLDSSVNGNKAPLNKDGKDGKKILLDTIAIFNTMYGIKIDLDPYTVALGIDKEKANHDPEVQGAIVQNEPVKPTAAEQIMNKTEQDHFMAQLDIVSVGLSAKHRTGLGFGVGTTSTELQATKDALADYKAYLANPKDPKFNGKSEIDMLNTLRTAADDYMRDKRAHGHGDTTAPDWLPKTKMGQNRFKANKLISKYAADRIAHLNQLEAQADKSISETIKETVDNIDDSIVMSKNGDELYGQKTSYITNTAAELIAWKTVSDKGFANARNSKKLFLEEKNKITGSYEFKTICNNISKMSDDECLDLLTDPISLAESYNFNNKAINEFDEQFKASAKGSIANKYYGAAKKNFVEQNYSPLYLGDMLALSMYMKDSGKKGKFDQEVYNNNYRDLIDEDILNDLTKDLDNKQIGELLQKPEELMNSYNNAVELSYKTLNENEIANAMPGSVTKYQNNIKEIINSEPPKNEEEFNNMKEKIMRNIANIIATRSLWKEPETRTEEQLTYDLGKERLKQSDYTNNIGIYAVKEKNRLPAGYKINTWSAMTDEEKIAAYGKEEIKAYKQKNAEKINQRNELSKRIYDEREDFKFMFDKAKTWDDVVKLSKIALTSKGNNIIHELSKSANELEKLKKPAAGHSAKPVNELSMNRNSMVK
ncbi:MAG: hypothetical protein IJ696_03095 [Ruminococcus sp.]|nr:hypothetical protein [Ruminococcus sp.]